MNRAIQNMSQENNEDEEINKYSNEILLLDFLITAYHLIVM